MNRACEMNRSVVLKKLIAIEPICKDEMFMACGWPMLEMEARLKELIETGEVVYSPAGWNQRRLYRVAEARRTS
jgi:hypothetical protein